MANRPDKGVHQQNLAVLRLTSMPACLIELGFITTPDEERLLNDAAQIDLISKGLYNAFVEYKNKNDNALVVPYKTEIAPMSTASDNDGISGNVMAENIAATTGDSLGDGASRNSDAEQQTAPVSRRQQVKREVKTKTAQKATGSVDQSRPVFKIQIMASSKKLRDGDASFKGLAGCECFEENGLVKYTYGASNNYNEIYRMHREIAEKFPGAFIIAFKNGQKMNVNQGIREFKQNRNK